MREIELVLLLLVLVTALTIIARRLTVCRSVVCASPDYLRARPVRRAEDLTQHNCLTHSYYGKTLWEFSVGGKPVSVAVSKHLLWANPPPDRVAGCDPRRAPCLD